MTSQSPRIYTYKITFEEVPYYYYGSKKEKRYNEYYMGSPVTNKWCWELYTPKKQILELFDYTDEGYEECRRVEDRLIKPVLNDEWCLNESCGGVFSLDIRRKNGTKQYENKVGIHTQTLEDKIELGRKTGLENVKLNRGFLKFSNDERSKILEPYRKINGYNSGIKHKKNKTGIFSRTPEQMTEDGKKGGRISGNITKQNGTGIFSLTEEQKFERSSKGGKKSSKITNSQRWECCETGYISTASGVVSYQSGRGIDTSKNNRRRIS